MKTKMRNIFAGLLLSVSLITSLSSCAVRGRYPDGDRHHRDGRGNDRHDDRRNDHYYNNH